MRKLPAILILIAACSCGSRKNGVPKFHEGDVVRLKLLKWSKGQIISVDCENKTPCWYQVRYQTDPDDEKLKEAKMSEVELDKQQ